jgi:hypothetical protein
MSNFSCLLINSQIYSPTQNLTFKIYIQVQANRRNCCLLCQQNEIINLYALNIFYWSVRGHIQKFPDWAKNEIYAWVCYGSSSPSKHTSEFMQQIHCFCHCWKHNWNWLFVITCRMDINCSWISGTSWAQCPHCYNFTLGNYTKWHSPNLANRKGVGMQPCFQWPKLQLLLIISE